MKPIVRSIPLLVFLLTGFPLMAQQVITTVKGEQFNTRVKRIDKEVVRTASRLSKRALRRPPQTSASARHRTVIAG